MRAERISINFSERENLSNEAKQIAKDGGKSNKKIMEASGAAFVLKEIGNATASGLQGNLYPDDEEKTEAAVSATAMAVSGLISDTANRITEQDSEYLEEQGDDPDHQDSERLERLLEDRKARAELIERGVDGERRRLRTEREVAEETGKKNALSDIRVAKIAERLEEADLPVTDSNVSRIAEAMNLAQEAQLMTDASFSYLIENKLQPTIQNCYKAVHSGRGGRRIVSDEAYKELAPSIEKVAKEAGLPETEQIKAMARKLLEDGIAITPENLTERVELGEIPKAVENGELSEDAVMDGAVEMLKYRHDPKETNLRVLLNREKARLSLTEQTSDRMKKLGVEPDLESIKQRIKDLETAEINAAKAQSKIGEVYGFEDPGKLFDETISACDTIGAAGERAVSETFARRYDITLGSLADAGKTILSKSTGDTAVKSYNALATEVRRDLGDSIQKAFEGIGVILKGLGLPETEGNVRAVRILGYNSMEITGENIAEMKYYDTEVSDLIHDMKPAVTAELIRRGVNPLETTVRELRNAAHAIAKELGTTPEERFGEYLVRMERSGKITAEQRESFVGIYRMLYQIGKTDGAAVGALVKSGRELTLKNLLTETRTRRRGRLDKSVDPTTGGREPVSDDEKLIFGLTIEEQVRTAYETSMLEKAAGKATPERLHLLLEKLKTSKGDITGFKPETLFETLSEIPEGPEDGLRRTEKLDSLRESLTGFETEKQFLEAFGESDSEVNVRAAKMLLSGTNAFAEIEKIGGEKETDKTLPNLPETEEGLAESLSRLSLNATEMMDYLYTEADLSGAEAKQLSEMSNLIRLSGRLCKRRFYNVPIEDENGVTNLNLTLIHETGSIGNFRISFDTGIFAEGKISNGRLNLFVTAENTETATKLKNGRDALSERLLALGFEKADVFTGVGKRREGFPEVPENEGKTETASLYRAARETVLCLRNLLK